MALSDLLILLARRDLSGAGVDKHVERFGKGRAPLDVVIADEAKDLILRIDCLLVVNGAVTKLECKPRCDTASMSNLEEVSAGEHLALKSLEHQETVKGSLASTDLYLITGKRLYGEKER